MVEIAVELGDILKILGWSRTKFFNKKEELIRLGVIFYRREGRPPVRRLRAFPGRLQKYISTKSKQGEIL